MKRTALILLLAILATILVAPGVASATTLPSEGAVVSSFPVRFSTNDLVGPGSVYFKVDGVNVAYVRPSAVWAWSEEEGDAVLVGYAASASAVIADGRHALTIVQGGATRYSGTFAVDAEPVLKDLHWGGDGVHIVVADNGPAATITTNAYKYDKSGAGASMTTISSTTAGGLTTVERLRPHALCCDLGDGWCCDIHGLSVKITDGYSPVTGRMTIDWVCVCTEEPTCGHYGDTSPEAISDHELYCLGLY